MSAKYIRPDCPKDFNKKRPTEHHALFKHLAHRHFSCEQCGKGMETSYYVCTHLRSHGCKECGKESRHETTISKHSNCQHCRTIFRSKKSLWSHKNHATHSTELKHCHIDPGNIKINKQHTHGQFLSVLIVEKHLL